MTLSEVLVNAGNLGRPIKSYRVRSGDEEDPAEFLIKKYKAMKGVKTLDPKHILYLKGAIR